MKTPLDREFCLKKVDKKGRPYLFAKAERHAINWAVAGDWNCSLVPTSVVIFRNQRDSKVHSYTFSCWFTGKNESDLEGSRICMKWILKYQKGGFVLLKNNKVNDSLVELCLNHLMPELILGKIDEFWELVDEKAGLPF